MALTTFERGRALKHLKGLRQRDEEYLVECAEWRAQGYRPHHCIHGTDLWVDYDNICGFCEDGASNYEIAIGCAHDDRRRYDAMWAMISTAQREYAPVAVKQALLDWIVEEWS